MFVRKARRRICIIIITYYEFVKCGGNVEWYFVNEFNWSKLLFLGIEIMKAL